MCPNPHRPCGVPYVVTGPPGWALCIAVTVLKLLIFGQEPHFFTSHRALVLAATFWERTFTGGSLATESLRFSRGIERPWKRSSCHAVPDPEDFEFSLAGGQSLFLKLTLLSLTSRVHREREVIGGGQSSQLTGRT